MAVVAFWSSSDKETGQTVSAAAIATFMAIEHNFRILLVDATFNDDTLERCFWTVNNKNSLTAQKMNKGKLDISSGAEGLASAIASNKATPEIITNYTRVVFKNRLDVLCGLKTTRVKLVIISGVVLLLAIALTNPSAPDEISILPLFNIATVLLLSVPTLQKHLSIVSS